MDRKTVFGLIWPAADTRDILLILLVILLLFLFFILLRAYLKANKNLSHEYQYMLFKAKSKGLTNFQYRILSGMTDMLHLKKPSYIITNPELYERSIGRFIRFLTSKEEDEHSLIKIFKDIVITYEKMYKDIKHKRPLESLEQLEAGHLLFFYTDTLEMYMGKILSTQIEKIDLQLFRRQSELKNMQEDELIHCYLWRPGDAEYLFDSKILSIENAAVSIARPETFTRGEEVRLPYVNVIIPCTLTYQQDEEPVTIEETIYKLGEQEIVIHSTHELQYRVMYTVSFAVADFTISSPLVMLSDKTVHEKGVSYYTFKMTELSDPARQVIRSYIYEHI